MYLFNELGVSIRRIDTLFGIFLVYLNTFLYLRNRNERNAVFYHRTDDIDVRSTGIPDAQTREVRCGVKSFALANGRFSGSDSCAVPDSIHYGVACVRRHASRIGKSDILDACLGTDESICAEPAAAGPSVCL